jgi:hypothetical protein
MASALVLRAVASVGMSVHCTVVPGLAASKASITPFRYLSKVGDSCMVWNLIVPLTSPVTSTSPVVDPPLRPQLLSNITAPTAAAVNHGFRFNADMAALQGIVMASCGGSVQTFDKP